MQSKVIARATTLVATLFALCSWTHSVPAQLPAPKSDATGTAQTSSPQNATGQRHLVMLVGLPGDDNYRDRITAAVNDIIAVSPQRLNVEPSHVHLLLADEEMVKAIPTSVATITISTADNLREFFASRSTQWSADDSCWLIMIGHSQAIGARSFFNVQGRDFTADDLAAWIRPIPCRQQVNVLTMPGSGAWLGALKGTSRVNIAATDSLNEFTGTEFPYALANILAGQQSHQALEDLDSDGRLSLLDLYLAVTLEVNDHYRSDDHLPTEHAQLDDNGDGKGKEIQEPLIPIPNDDETSDSESSPPKPRVVLSITDNSDGAVARSIAVQALVPQPTKTN